MQRSTTSNGIISLESTLRAWRTQALNVILAATAIAATPMIVIVIVEAIRDPAQWPAALAFAAIYLLITGLAVFRGLDSRLRAWGLLLPAYTAGALAFARGGLAGDGRVYLLALPVVALILVGLRAGLTMAVLSLLTFAAFAATAHFGWMAGWLIRQDNTLRLLDWGAGGAAFTLALAALIALQWSFSRFQRAVVTDNVRLLEESEGLRDFNETIVQGVQEGIVLENATGQITFVNPRIAELLDWAPEELMGQHWKTVVAPEHVAKVEEETARRPRGITSRYEAELLAKEGRRIPVIVSARPLFEGEHFAGVLSVLTDITERKQMEEMLREREEMLQAVLDATTESVLLLDNQGAILTLNQTAAQRLGGSIDELVGLRPQDLARRGLASSEMVESRVTLIDEVVHSGKPASAEGERGGRIYDTSYYPIFDAEGGVARLAVFSRDITARRRAELQAIRAERLSAMGYVAAALAHEVNNPLQSVRTNLELLLTFDLDPDEHRQRLGITLEEVERLAEIAQRVLDFARPVEATRRLVPIAGLVKKTLALMARQLELARVRVTTSLPADLPPVCAAPDQIAQVLLNLMINAVEAMPDGGHLDIAGCADAGMLVLAVANDGPHLTSEQIGHIFDPFFTTKPDGTGLGLCISYGIIQQHGGTVNVENLEGGRGVTFTVTLPIARPSKEPEVTA
jgi:PAS domain S-box-containing protein